ncbi:PIN domain-containing protein [Pseudofrankia saprophytica]|uniref:PIN domain-containing protein n=1 Tax=Pseudofrankia saprophytica TaxID=298655 RepID=UPI000234D478|nr:PIN domain-containing protein [Pseudofrankia saprophytica]
MIIADTSAILASIDTHAADHAACTEIIKRIQRPMLVSHMVIAEADYLLTTRFGLAAANRFLTDVARGSWELAASDTDDINTVVTINTRYEDLKLGATDCLNVALAARYGARTLFTLDHRHYRVTAQLGRSEPFALLPADRDSWLKQRRH